MFCEVDGEIKQNDAREGKNMQISAKYHQKYAKLCKNKPFFAYETLVLFKKTVKIDVSTYESVQQVGVRKGPEWILSVFKLFDEGLYDF